MYVFQKLTIIINMFKSFLISLLLILPKIISQSLLKKFFSFDIHNSKISPLNFFNFKTAKIINTKIGAFNYFKVDELIFYNSTVRNFNIVKLLKSIELKGNLIGVGNKIYGFKTKDLIKNNNSIFIMDEKSELSGKHFFDVCDKIIIGKNVVIGGFNSVFWTHGFDHKRNFVKGPIILGDNIFIGSHTTLTHGIMICNDVTIGTRSLITKSIKISGFYASSNKIRQIS